MPHPRRKPSHLSASPDGPPRAWLYARVSTEAQAEKETSIPAQLSACRAHARAQGWTLAGESQDRGITGSTTERPGLQAALSAARHGEYDVLLVHKLDRLSRSPGDTFAIKALLLDCGARVASATETFVGSVHPMDEAMEGMAATFARLYVANLRTEVHKGLRQLAAPGEGVQPVGPEYDGPGTGRQAGLPPYGYRLSRPDVRGSAWVAHEEAAAWVDFMYRALAAGQMPADICRTLNRLGVPPPSAQNGHPGRPGLLGRTGRPPRYISQPGYTSQEAARTQEAAGNAAGDAEKAASGPPRPLSGWYPQIVQKILTHRAYRGQVHYQGAWYPGVHPALVDAPLWMRVQEILAARAPGRAERSGALLSGGLLRCPLCHAAGRVSPLYAVQSGRLQPDGSRSFHYRCGLHFIKNSRRRVGGTAARTEAQEACEGFQLSESKVLPLLQAYLRECAAGLSPEETQRLTEEMQSLAEKQPLSEMQLAADEAAACGLERAWGPETGGRVSRRHAEERRRSLEAEAAALPALRQKYQKLAARDLMTEDELGEQLAELADRGREIHRLLALEEEAQAERPALMPPPSALLLLQLLGDPAVTPLQKRDRLRSVFSHLIPSADKQGLEVYFL